MGSVSSRMTLIGHEGSMNGVMSINVVFTCFSGILLLYKIYILSPSPKPTNHRKLAAFLNFQNKSLSMIYRLSSS